MKAIIYTRGGNESRQIEECEKYAKANGITVVEAVSTENGLSAYVFNMKIDAIIVCDAPRIARKKSDYMFTEDMLQKFGIKLLVAEGK